MKTLAKITGSRGAWNVYIGETHIHHFSRQTDAMAVVAFLNNNETSRAGALLGNAPAAGLPIHALQFMQTVCDTAAEYLGEDS